MLAAIEESLLQLEGSGVTYESGSGDYAEWLRKADPHEALRVGDVVGVQGGRVSRQTRDADQLMVVSLKPVVLGNMPDKRDLHLYEKVAFMGQVPVAVRGVVEPGDYILASGLEDGSGWAVSPHRISTEDLPRVVGVAWSGSTQEGLKYVRVAVGLKSGELFRALDEQRRTIARLEAQVEQQRSETAAALAQLKQGNDRFRRLEAAFDALKVRVERLVPPPFAVVASQ